MNELPPSGSGRKHAAFHREISPKLIEKLIAIGHSGDTIDTATAELLGSIKSRDEINTLHPNTWDAVSESLSTPDLILMVKGLVVTERENRWLGGSVSAGIWTFHAVCRRDHMLGAQLAYWILPRTRNDYVVSLAKSHLGSEAPQHHPT